MEFGGTFPTQISVIVIYMVNEYILQDFTKEELNQPLQSPHSGENWSEESLLKASGLGRRDFEYTHVVFLRQSLKAKLCLFFEHREFELCNISLIEIGWFCLQ